MHILFVTTAYPPFPGGGERYVAALASELAQRGQHLTVLTSSARVERDLWQGRPNPPTTETIGNITVIRCGLPGMPGGQPALLAWRKLMVLLSQLPGNQSAVLRRMARRIPPISGLTTALKQIPRPVDIVHGFNISWEHPLITSGQWAQTQHIPFIVTPFAHFGHNHGRPGWPDRVALNATMDHQCQLMSSSDAVLTLTRIESDNLQRYGVQNGRFAVIGSGLDPLPATIVPATRLLAQHNIHDPYFLFIGRANRDKGALDAMEAVLTLRRQHHAVNLVLIGQTTPQFHRHYQNLTISERQAIRPLGILSEADKHSLLSACTGLLLPSRSDSFGIVFLEAWAHGKPVIGANAGGIPGVVDDGQNGFLVPFGAVPELTQAMEKLLTDSRLGKTMGQHGQQKVAEQYTWSQVGDRVWQIYQQILSSVSV